MVLEVNVLFLLSASVLNVKHTYKVSCPASYKPIEYLKQDPRQNTKLREGVWQCQQYLSYL